MINIVKYAIFLIFLILLQVSVLSHIDFMGYINPYLYIYFILVLPLQLPRLHMLIIGFVLGLSMDMMLNTPGLHTIPTVLVAYIRGYVAQKSMMRGELEGIDSPMVFTMGLSAFLVYSGTLVMIHHSLLFLLDSFRWQRIFSSLLNALYSSLMTMVLILIIQYVFVSRKKVRMY
jgi:rod shape-determining protein MreD